LGPYVLSAVDQQHFLNIALNLYEPHKSFKIIFNNIIIMNKTMAAEK